MSYYQDLSALPKSVRHSLPLHARVIYMNAFNRAWEEHPPVGEQPDGNSREEVSGQIAWAAVRKVYEQDAQTGKWKKISTHIAI